MSVFAASIWLCKAGYALTWLRPWSKAPVAPGWSTAPVVTVTEFRQTYRPGYNLGVRCGHWSQPITNHGLIIIDTDIRRADGTTSALEALAGLCGDDIPPIVISGFGMGSRHSWYATPLDRLPPKANVTIRQSEMMFIPPGKDTEEPIWKIEVLGTGKQVVCPPSIHPNGQLYRWLTPLITLPPLPESVHSAIEAALAAKVKPYDPGSRPASLVTDGDRPGDDFNRRADWRDILEPHGWVPVRHRVSVTHWRRPGKGEGISATTNYKDSGLLYVFSSNAQPFEEDTAYTPFAAYTVLEHSGDFQAAARVLARRGYGVDTGSRKQAQRPLRDRAIVRRPTLHVQAVRAGEVQAWH